MTTMTPEQRAAISPTLKYTPHPAAPELVQHVAELSFRARGFEPGTAEWLAAAVTLVEQTGPIVRRLLDAERDIEALRRILAEAVAVADDNPDDGLTAGDLLRLCAAAGLDLRADIEHAETLRDAEQLAGAGGRYRLYSDLEGMGR